MGKLKGLGTIVAFTVIPLAIGIGYGRGFNDPIFASAPAQEERLSPEEITGLQKEQVGEEIWNKADKEYNEENTEPYYRQKTSESKQVPITETKPKSEEPKKLEEKTTEKPVETSKIEKPIVLAYATRNPEKQSRENSENLEGITDNEIELRKKARESVDSWFDNPKFYREVCEKELGIKGEALVGVMRLYPYRKTFEEAERASKVSKTDIMARIMVESSGKHFTDYGRVLRGGNGEVGLGQAKKQSVDDALRALWREDYQKIRDSNPGLLTLFDNEFGDYSGRWDEWGWRVLSSPKTKKEREISPVLAIKITAANMAILRTRYGAKEIEMYRWGPENVKNGNISGAENEWYKRQNKKWQRNFAKAESGIARIKAQYTDNLARDMVRNHQYGRG